jgi:hypothetical protein
MFSSKSLFGELIICLRTPTAFLKNILRLAGLKGVPKLELDFSDKEG